MGLIEKLENLVNKLLILMGELFMRFLSKITPPGIKKIAVTISGWIERGIHFCKNLPARLIKSAPLILAKIKGTLAEYDFKAKLQESYKAAMVQYANSKPSAKISGFKKTLLTPFLIIGQWLKGLTAPQKVMLLGFTAASILSVINIVSTGNRIVEDQLKANRAPASVEEEVQYERPEYYKKQTRHLDMTSIRLPVYFANVNELRSIDIDFTATLSNRMARMKLELLEFQLRDHLVLNIEPMVANFPLEEEGKEILRVKLLNEINDFMKERQVEGEVSDLKLTYILAN